MKQDNKEGNKKGKEGKEKEGKKWVRKKRTNEGKEVAKRETE